MFGHQDLMLCTATGKPFTRSGWLFELKYDGFRVLIAKHGKQMRLLSRRGRDMARSFPELIACLRDLPDVVIDGELVVLNDMGAPQFERLRWRALMSQHREVTHAAQTEPAAIFAFDLLAIDGHDLRKQTLLERKAALEKVLARCPRIKFASHIEHEGETFYDQVSQLGLEGVVCKRASSLYVAGPSRDWLKIKTAAGMQVDDERLRHLRA